MLDSDIRMSLFTYVKNRFQYLPNYNPEELGLYGCVTAEYNEDKGTYECLECENHISRYFIPVITDKSRIPPSSNGLSDKCLEAEKNKGIYSCTKCLYNSTKVKDISTNKTNCFERKIISLIVQKEK